MEPANERYSSNTVDGKELTARVLTWGCPFKGSIKHLDEIDNWYKFLNSLYCKLSEYPIQLAKRYDEIPDIYDFQKNECDIVKYIESEAPNIEFETFLNKTVECNVTEYENVKNIRATELQVKELIKILQITLIDKVYVSCKGQNIIFEGNYITTGDIRDAILLLERGSKVAVSCNDIIFNEKSKLLNIFVFNTFFIDVDIKPPLTKSLKIRQINVIAPKWEIIGRRKIELKGENGKLSKIGYGIDGKPGKPGGPGGNFFGIGKEFINGKNLEISVSGGDGSRGQMGKDGENGRDGSTPTVPSNQSCRDSLCDDDKRINSFKCKKSHCLYTGCTYCAVSVSYNRVVWCEYEIFGETGTNGINGGKGGKGGNGGYPGNIVLYELENPSEISQLKNYGNDGADGRGGRGGIGGKKGNDMKVKCEKHFFTLEWSLLNNKTSLERNASGRNGNDGANFNGMEMRKEATNIIDLDKAKILNQYKRYLRENLNYQFIHILQNNFLNQLDNNNKVKRIYDTLGLIDELQNLEDHFLKLRQDINFLPIYHLFLKRLSEYAKSPKEDGDNNQYQKVLRYLYTATLGRIHNMEDNLESNLIIDISTYFKSVKEDISKLKDLGNAKYKKELINKYNEKYKSEIDLKIKEAQQLILQEVTPQIDNLGVDIDIQMETLVNEVIFVEQQTRKEHDELTKKHQELEKVLVQHELLSALKTYGLVVSFLGPVGAIAGSVIGTGSSILESFNSATIDDYHTISQLPQCVYDFEFIKRRIGNISNQGITCLKNSLKNISPDVIKHPVIVNISAKVSDVTDGLNEMDEIRFDFMEIQTLEKELEGLLKLQERGSGEEKGTKLADLKELKKYFHLCALIPDIYNKYKKEKVKLDTISNVIIENESKLKMIKQYEQGIFQTLKPMLQNIQNDLDNVVYKFPTQSKVTLNVSKWRVKSTLRDIQNLMQELTQGFQVQATLMRCIEKLEETMIILIDVHEHIEDYHKDQYLADFVANISSIAVADINIIYNPKFQETLRNAVSNLEITVRSNIIVQRHKVAINAFKQFVFPFAHVYFTDLILPAYLEINSNKNNTTLEKLISRANTEIVKINEKLEDYKNTVTKRDGCIGMGRFESGYISSKPFFVWKNEQHKNMISKLLSGEVVIVKADIRNSSPYKDAIKFNVAEFHFKSKNITLQFEIDTKLKHFQIFAVHLGNSYYRYENKIYRILTASHETWYYFEKSNGEPLDYSFSYHKIKHGNATLSPYASWKIKLDIVSDESSFNDLEIYKDEVDLVLEGNGHYINKKSMHCQDLMVDKYYKPFEEYSRSYANALANRVDNVPALQDNTFRRFKRETNRDLKEEKLTMLNEKYEFSQKDRENTNTESNSWFSWIRLPNFNIFPLAEATTIEDDATQNIDESDILNDDIFTQFINSMKLFKDAFLSKLCKSYNSIGFSNLYENDLNNYTYHNSQENTSKFSDFIYVGIDNSENNTDILEQTSFDINGNLILGQLLVNKVFGSNESTSYGIHYLSPQKEQQLRIIGLEKRILSIIHNNSLDDYNINSFMQNYTSSPQWYKNIYKDEFDEFMKQRRISSLAKRILPIIHSNSLSDYNINKFIQNYTTAPQWYKNLYKDEFEKLKKQRSINEKKDTCESSSEQLLTDNSRVEWMNMLWYIF